jgi:hypothetical protein
VRHRMIGRWLIGVFSLWVMFILSACQGGDGGPTSTPGGTTAPTGTPMATNTPPPTDTPAPTGTPYPAEDFGVTWSSSWYEGAYSHNAPQQKAVDIGATWDRWDFRWNRIMDPRDVPTPVWEGEFGGTSYSYQVAIDGDRGTSPPLKLLGILNNLPSDRSTVSFEDNGTWEEFVRAVFDKYDYAVDAWEVGNETGFVHENPDIGGDPPVAPEDYVKALNIVCNVVGTDGEPIVLGSPVAQIGVTVATEGHYYDQENPFSENKPEGWVTYRDILDLIRGLH